MAGLISVDEARDRVLEQVAPLASEDVRVEDALGRVLAEDVVAPHDVPPFVNSAMDGYAVVEGPAGRRLTIIGEARAGRPATRALRIDEAIRISTGAVVPEGATAVIRVEDTEEREGYVTLNTAVRPHQNIRDAGEDLRAGQVVLRAGTLMGPAELGAAVGAARAMLACARRPRLGLVVTGDELAPPGGKLGPGQIHNSNAVTLAALAARAGAIVAHVDHAPDDRGAVQAALARVLPDSDVVVVSGGVSVGEHDHVKTALAQLGAQESFWGVALKPGKPTWFGARGSQLVFGLPGNPVSAMVTFLLFVAPALRALQGAVVAQAGTAVLGDDISLSKEREQAIRVKLEPGAVAHVTGPQGSHVLSSMLGADALALVPAGEGVLRAGTSVRIESI